jgi:hypothetical protein
MRKQFSVRTVLPPILSPGPRRRTGVFIDFRASDASSAYSASRGETGEASFVLRVEITKGMHAVR